MGKFFNTKVKNSKKRKTKSKKKNGSLKGLIRAIVIVIIIILLGIGIAFLIRNANKTKLVLKDNIDVEINGEFPKTKDYFSTFKKYDEKNVVIDLKNVDITRLGEYTAHIKCDNYVDKDIVINIVDTTKPEVVFKDVKYDKNHKYVLSDFINECKDNSNNSCQYDISSEKTDDYIKFIVNVNDGNGNVYTKEFKFDLEQKPASNNTTSNNTTGNTNVVINNTVKPEEPKKCQYGSNVKDSYYNFPIAYSVVDETTKCAINRADAGNSKYLDLLENIVNKDVNKLKSQINDKIKAEATEEVNVSVFPETIAVYNVEGLGLVGYAIRVKLYVSNISTTLKIDNDANLKMDYYIKSDGSRNYIKNVYNIK